VNIIRQVERVEELCRKWSIDAEDAVETEGSLIAFGLRGDQPVVLKVTRQQGDEWRCGEVLKAFDGCGTVNVIDHVEGAVLMERLSPATCLADLSLRGRDREATGIIADVIKRMCRPVPDGEPHSFPTVRDWGRSFERYLASGDQQIQYDLVSRAQVLYYELCESQKNPHLLHGDLHHYNILFDDKRGWVAIDPKGVVGEVEYEIGTSLRNPYERPELITSSDAIASRLLVFSNTLQIDINRTLAWGFSQAVLSAIWSVEDGYEIEPMNTSIVLANELLGLL
jgi:streptomycin 6-kinase